MFKCCMVKMHCSKHSCFMSSAAHHLLWLQFDDDESVAGARTAFWRRSKFWRILVPILVSAGLAAAAIALLITHPDKASLCGFHAAAETAQLEHLAQQGLSRLCSACLRRHSICLLQQP